MFWPVLYCAFFAATIFARIDPYHGLNPLNTPSLYARSNNEESGGSEPEKAVGYRRSETASPEALGEPAGSGHELVGDTTGQQRARVLSTEQLKQLWDTYEAAGWRLWREWELKTGRDDRLRASRFQNHVVTAETPDTLPITGSTKDVIDILLDERLLAANFFDISVQARTQDGGDAHINCATDVGQGLFVAQLQDQKDLTSNHASLRGIGWWMWYTAAERMRGTTDLESALYGLTYLVLDGLDDKMSQELMDYALGFGEEGYVPSEPDSGGYFFTPTEGNEQGAFWVLLGLASVNTISIMQMITDHKQLLRGKGVVGITIWYDEDAYPPPGEEASKKYVMTVELGIPELLCT